MAILALVVAIGAGYGIISKMQQQEVALSERAMLNLEALARGESPCPERPPNFPLTPEERYQICRGLGGYWNELSAFLRLGHTTVTVAAGREITILGLTIFGGTWGRTYFITWEEYSCRTSSGNCCYRQGPRNENKRRL